MKHLLIGLGVLLTILIAVALLAPSFVDWNRYKGEITRRVEEATGRRLTIDGTIRLALLPTPRLSVSEVRIAGLPGSTVPELLRLKALEAHIAFAGLLAGRVQIESLALIEPQLELERLADGRGNWQLPPARGAAPPAATPGAAADAASPPLPPWLQLDRVTIENGAVAYRDAKSGKTWSVGQIVGGLSAGSPLGPFRAQGHALLDKLPLTIDASLERLGGNRPAGVGLRLGITGAQLDFGGSVSDAKDGPEFSGKLRASSPNLSAAAAALGLAQLAVLPAVNQSMAFEATLNTGGRKLVLSQASLRLGESGATGSITYQPGEIGRAAATLSLTRVDLEKWLPLKPAPAAVPAAGSSAASPTADAGPISFMLPDDIEATLDVALDGILYKGGVVRQIRFGAALNKGELALTQFTAELPGGSDVTLYGALRTPLGKPLFTGNIEAASDNLRALLDWLKIDVRAVPAERLRRLSLSSALQLAPDRLQLRDVDAELDSSHLVGAATVLLQERPSFGASVAVDRLNLDAYLPQTDGAKPAAAPAAAAAASANPALAAAAAGAASDTALALLGGFDANLRLRLDELIYRGEPIRGIHLDGTVERGALTLREVSVDDLAGVKGKVQGSLVGSGGVPTLDLSFDLSDAELTGLLHFAGWRPALPFDQLGAAALKGHLAGAIDKLAFELNGSLVDGTFRLAGTAGNGTAGPLYDLEVSAKQLHLERLQRLFPSDMPAAAFGTLDLSGHVSGDATKIAVTGLKSQSALLAAAGDISVAEFPHMHTLALNLELKTSRLATVLSLAGVKAPSGLDQLGRADAVVKLNGDRSGYALDGKLAVGAGSLALVGQSARSEAGPTFALTLDAEEPELVLLLQALMPDYRPLGAKLGAFQLHAKAEGSTDKFELTEIAAKLGTIALTGSAAATLQGARPKLSLKLEANAIELDPFLPAEAGERAQIRRPRGQAVTAASRRWSTAALELTPLTAVDADISLAASALSYGQYRVEGAKLSATLDNAVLTLAGLTGTLYGGELKIAGTLAAAPEPKASLSLRLDGAKLEQAGLKVGQLKLSEGTLAASAELATSGTSELALVRGLNGNGRLDMEGGTIQGLDLDTANARLARGGRVDIFTLARAAASGGETKLKRLAGTFVVKDGVAETKDLTLEADAAHGKGDGSIDLPRWYMEFEAGFTLAAAGDAPPFYIKLNGPPDAPRKILDSNAFQEWLTKRDAAAALKTSRKGAAAPPPPRAASPDSIIDNIIKKLPPAP